MSGPRSSRFSPRSIAPEQLEVLTVGREPLLRQLQDVVSGAVVSRQARFDLILGPRGAGKSHVVRVLQGRLGSSPQLADRAVVIAPPEELHPTSLVQLLAHLLREFPDDPELGPTSEALRSLRRQRDGDQEQRAIRLIRGRLDGRAMVILLENLDELFTALGRDGQLRLRNILQTERSWSVVASSRSLIPAFTKHEAPFHGTFNQHRLELLSAEQCRDMLARLARAHAQTELADLLETPKGLARVRGIHHLLGGNPRAMAFMFRQLDAHRLDHFEEALADLADELKPYFQEQMTRLSPIQRGIMDILAENWRPLTVTEITEEMYGKQASISGALRNLKRDALVQVLEVGRERLYELGDPLNRLAKANERPRDAIVAFARVMRWWYADDSHTDFMIREPYLFPEGVRSLAAEGFELVAPTSSALERTSAVLALPHPQAIAQAREQLSRRESPTTRATLVVALERSGDEEAAVDTLLDAPGPNATMTQIQVVTVSLSASGLTGEPSLETMWAAPLESPIARAVRSTMQALVEPSSVATRRPLLEAFEDGSPAIVRLASELVVHSNIISHWAREGAFSELGQLLAHLAPSESTVSLERDLFLAIQLAWHHQRIPQLLSIDTDLSTLLSLLPESLRWVLALASFDAVDAIDDRKLADHIMPELFRRSQMASSEAPKGALDEIDGFEFEPQVICPLWLKFFTLMAHAPQNSWVEHFPREFVVGTLSPRLLAGVYYWLASRRPLAPLVKLAVRLHELYGATFLPLAILESKSPREAVARLSAPEREMLHGILVSLGDEDAITELGLSKT